VTADGTCSRPDDLEPEPFDVLAHTVGVKSPEDAGYFAAVRRLAVLKSIVESLAKYTASDWLGVYRVIESPSAARPTSVGEQCLVKESYVGAPSRPFFPLTPAFAELSNNSTVALTGSAILLPDTRKLGAEEPYYVCDGKVRSELCAPITCPSTGKVIGIIDAESFAPQHYSGSAEGDARTNAILLACQRLGEAGLLVDMLTEA
jgi:putative methionine-R-sulfoxide reductase with GAF domain